MKSVKVFRLVIIFPASCQASPSSPPPRMWATVRHNATIKQRQNVGGKCVGHRDSIGPVSIYEKGIFSRFEFVLAIHDGDGDTSSVLRGTKSRSTV